jgi:malate dehydrogenase
MSRMLTAADVESAPGKRLVLAPGDRLTPLARDRAKDLGVELVAPGAPNAALAAPAQPKPVAVSTSVSTPFSAPARPVAAGGYRPLVLPPSGAMYRRNALPRSPALQDARPKAGVVGAGHVGAMTALRLAESDLFSNVALVDVVPGLAAGLALDMWHGAGLYRFSTLLSGSDDLATLAGCDYIVVTAGKPRQPGMSRTDLTAVNAAIIEAVSQGIRAHAPQATLVIVSNPLEEMTHLAAKFTGFPEERVLGMAGVLDSARFCALVGLTGCAKPQDVHAHALGSHGPEMVIPLSQAFVGNQPIESVLDADTLKAIVERTRESGAEVVKLLQKGSAYFSPAESAAAMVRAMVQDRGEVLAACVRSRGAYGLADTRVGLPVRLHRGGLKEVVPLNLRADEQTALREAAARIAERIAALGK